MCVYIHNDIYTHACIYIHVFKICRLYTTYIICVSDTCVCVYIYIYTHTHIYIHALKICQLYTTYIICVFGTCLYIHMHVYMYAYVLSIHIFDAHIWCVCMHTHCCTHTKCMRALHVCFVHMHMYMYVCMYISVYRLWTCIVYVFVLICIRWPACVRVYMLAHFCNFGTCVLF